MTPARPTALGSLTIPAVHREAISPHLRSRIVSKIRIADTALRGSQGTLLWVVPFGPERESNPRGVSCCSDTTAANVGGSPSGLLSRRTPLEGARLSASARSARTTDGARCLCRGPDVSCTHNRWRTCFARGTPARGGVVLYERRIGTHQVSLTVYRAPARGLVREGNPPLGVGCNAQPIRRICACDGAFVPSR